MHTCPKCGFNKSSNGRTCPECGWNGDWVQPGEKRLYAFNRMVELGADPCCDALAFTAYVGRKELDHSLTCPNHTTTQETK